MNSRGYFNIFETKEMGWKSKSSITPIVPSKQGVVEHSGETNSAPPPGGWFGGFLGNLVQRKPRGNPACGGASERRVSVWGGWGVYLAIAASGESGLLGLMISAPKKSSSSYTDHTIVT